VTALHEVWAHWSLELDYTQGSPAGSSLRGDIEIDANAESYHIELDGALEFLIYSAEKSVHSSFSNETEGEIEDVGEKARSWGRRCAFLGVGIVIVLAFKERRAPIFSSMGWTLAIIGMTILTPMGIMLDLATSSPEDAIKGEDSEEEIQGFVQGNQSFSPYFGIDGVGIEIKENGWELALMDEEVRKLAEKEDLNRWNGTHAFILEAPNGSTQRFEIQRDDKIKFHLKDVGNWTFSSDNFEMMVPWTFQVIENPHRRNESYGLDYFLVVRGYAMGMRIDSDTSDEDALLKKYGWQPDQHLLRSISNNDTIILENDERKPVAYSLKAIIHPPKALQWWAIGAGLSLISWILERKKVGEELKKDLGSK